MSEWKDYEPWLEELKDSASIEGITLNLDKYHYHTYFIRGWSTEAVMSELIEKDWDAEPPCS